MAIENLPEFIRTHYEVQEWRHAIAILQGDFPEEWNDIVEVLTSFRLHKKDILVGGGNKSPMARAIDQAFFDRGWIEKSFDTRIVIDQRALESPTHEVDCFKNRIAIEVEWNNKDPFYDRDLNNFRLLFELRAISVGVLITRCTELQEIFNDLGKGSSYGASTTHMSKLIPRVEGGGGGGCPIVVFGISKKLYVEDGVPYSERP
ncbi:MAG: BglII/BstYI family type II restriction endonuclease [Anaerolineae bacterium]